MSDEHPEQTALILTPREQRALRDLIQQQISIDESGMFPARPTAEERDEAMHGSRRPLQDGEAVLWPIACRASELAKRRDEALPACRWVADGEDSVACTRCGKLVGPGMVRHEFLTSISRGTYRPVEASPRSSMTIKIVRDL